MAARSRPTEPKLGRLGQAVAKTLDNLKTEPADAGLAELARVYAETIDQLVAGGKVELLGQTGPTLVRVLESLGASPRARAARTSRRDQPPPPAAEQAKSAQVIALERLEKARADRGKRAAARK